MTLLGQYRERRRPQITTGIKTNEGLGLTEGERLPLSLEVRRDRSRNVALPRFNAPPPTPSPPTHGRPVCAGLLLRHGKEPGYNLIREVNRATSGVCINSARIAASHKVFMATIKTCKCAAAAHPVWTSTNVASGSIFLDR